MDKIKSKQKCEECEKSIYIGEMNICQKCRKMLCNKCLLNLSRHSDEVNFEYHYKCFDEKKKRDEPGIFAKMYIDSDAKNT